MALKRAIPVYKMRIIYLTPPILLDVPSNYAKKNGCNINGKSRSLDGKVTRVIWKTARLTFVLDTSDNFTAVIIWETGLTNQRILIQKPPVRLTDHHEYLLKKDLAISKGSPT